MKKLYYAYVAKDVVKYFEKKLKESSDDIKIVSKSPATSESGKPLLCFVLEAEEGVIDSRWELK